ncbi:MAG: hypothetical protein Q8J97_02345, partial [Flavobacteriaceae bacterium]|nr:hypothetical protein [Flavobacteriaceae bacterium]
LSSQPSTTAELNLPKCLEWGSAVVVGTVMTPNEAHALVKEFLAFAAAALRENPRIAVNKCFDTWMNTKHVLHHAKRVGAAYSLLHAIHSLDDVSLTTNARLFLALVSGEVPFDSLLIVNRVIEEISETLERKQGSFSSITRTLLRTVLKKHFTWMSKENLEELYAVVERQFEIGYDQIAADVLCARDGQFVEFLTMYTLSSIAAHQQFVADSVLAINTGGAAALSSSDVGDSGAASADGHRSGCAPISTVFSMLQHCDPDKPYPKHEADCSYLLGWNLESGDFTMDAPVNLHEFSNALRHLHAIVRYTPKQVASQRGVASLPWRITKITDETGAGVVSIYGSPDRSDGAGASGGAARRKSIAA